MSNDETIHPLIAKRIAQIGASHRAQARGAPQLPPAPAGDGYPVDVTHNDDLTLVVLQSRDVKFTMSPELARGLASALVRVAKHIEAQR